MNERWTNKSGFCTVILSATKGLILKRNVNGKKVISNKLKLILEMYL